MPQAEETVDVGTMPFGEILAAVNGAKLGLGQFARACRVPGDAWRSALADLMGVDGAADEEVPVYRLGVRTTLLTDVDPHRKCYLIVSGRFDEYRLSVRASVRWTGDLVGYMPLLSPLDDPFWRCTPAEAVEESPGGLLGAKVATGDPTERNREGSEVRTCVPSVVVPIDGRRFVELLDTNLTFARVMLRYMAEHGSDYLDDHDQYDEAFEQYFPGRSGMLTPPPYTVGQADMRIFFCKKPEDPALLEQMLPPATRWYPEFDFYLLVCTEMRDIAPKWHPGATFSYDEVAVFVPAQHGLDPRLYFHVPFMFPDNIMAIYMGREILGLPKRRAANFCEEFTDADPGLWRFLMRRMLPQDARDRQTALGFHLPKQVDVLDMRWRKVGPEDEAERFGDLVGALWGEVVPDVLAKWFASKLGDVFGVLLEQGADAIDGEGTPLEKVAAKLNAVLPYIPESLRSVNTTAWKRIFASEVSTHGSGEQRWRRGDFESDCIACTPFPIRKIHALEAIDASESLGGGLYTTRGFPLTHNELITPIGLRVNVEMGLEPGRVVHDFRRDLLALSYKRRNRLAWGPYAGDDTF